MEFQPEFHASWGMFVIVQSWAKPGFLVLKIPVIPRTSENEDLRPRQIGVFIDAFLIQRGYFARTLMIAVFVGKTGVSPFRYVSKSHRTAALIATDPLRLGVVISILQARSEKAV